MSQLPLDPEQVRQDLLTLTAELGRLDSQLDRLIEPLPVPNGAFVPLAELRGTVAVVRTDLLADAIATLQAVAAGDEVALRRNFDERSRLLARAGQ